MKAVVLSINWITEEIATSFVNTVEEAYGLRAAIEEDFPNHDHRVIADKEAREKHAEERTKEVNMKLFDIKIASGEVVSVPGYDVCPGLAITKWLSKNARPLDGKWTITHLPSGSAFTDPRSLKDIRRLADSLKSLMDYSVGTLSWDDMEKAGVLKAVYTWRLSQTK